MRRQLCGQSGELREPKTKAGTRFVELPSFVISRLRTWKLRCPKGELDLCFPNRDGAASLMIAAGCDIASVSRQLGHSNVAVTLAVYSHWFQKRSDSGLGSQLEAFLAKESGCDLVVGGDSEDAPSAEVIDKTHGPGRIRTYDQGIMSRPSRG